MNIMSIKTITIIQKRMGFGGPADPVPGLFLCACMIIMADGVPKNRGGGSDQSTELVM